MGLGLDNPELADIRSIISIVIKSLGWLLLALFVGALVATRLANGLNGLALGGGSLLAGAILGRWVGRRWVLKSARYFWIPAILLLVAGLVVSVRNTPLGVAPIHIIALGAAGLALAVALAGVLRYQGRAAMWRSVSIVVLSLGMLAAVGFDATMAYRTETITLANSDVQLEGTISVPRGDGPFPAVLFIHGSGPELRSTSRPVADRLAREGFITLIWDKRGSGASVGGSPSDSFTDLASDVVAWVELLEERSDIDPNGIVLWGSSEGGWVAPIAAEQADISALVLISPGVQFGETVYYEKESRLRSQGISEAEIVQALDLRLGINDFYRTGADRDRVLNRLEELAGEPWYVAAVEVGLLPTPDEVTEPGASDTIKFLELQDFTLFTSLREFDGPVLATFGFQDQCNPAAQNAQQISALLDELGTRHLVLEYPEAGHGVLIWLSGEVSCGMGIPPVSFPADYLDTVASWLSESLQPAS